MDHSSSRTDTGSHTDVKTSWRGITADGTQKRGDLRCRRESNMYHTDDLLRKHHLLIEDLGEDDSDLKVRLVDWETHELAHTDAALAYLGELAHGNPGFPGEDVSGALLEWVAGQPRPVEEYVRAEPNPNQCFACGGPDHEQCGCPGHWEILDRIQAYLGSEDGKGEEE
jgi:hypothetical protein